VLFRGDFERGDRSPFERYHAVPSTPPRIEVVSKPVADGLNTQGRLAARIEVRPGDNGRMLDPVTGRQVGSHAYRERAELAQVSPFPGRTYVREGDELWLGWQTMFPRNQWNGVDRRGGGTIFLQYHHVDLRANSFNGSPPLMFFANRDSISVTQCERYMCPESSIVTRHREPLRYDHWYTFVVHMIHSSDPRKGLLEVWVDGEKRVSVRTALLFGPNFANYMLTGQYRRPNSPATSVMYADNYVVATTEAEVLSALGPAALPNELVEAPIDLPGEDEAAFGADLPPTGLDLGPLHAAAGCQQAGASAAAALLGTLVFWHRRRRRA
jgi:hypothetical protein